MDSIAIEGILGDESPVPSTTGFPVHNRRPAADSKVRQLHGNGLDQHTKGDNVRLPLRVDGASSPMDGNPHRAPGYKIPPGTIECPSGPPQPPEPNAGYRVVSPPGGSIDFHPYMGVADDRPVRDTPQCGTTPVLAPHPRSTSRLRERCQRHLVHPTRVGVPALPSRWESSGRSQRDPKSLHDTGLPPRVKEGVVLPPPPPADPTTPGTSSAGSPPAATPLQSAPRRRPCPEPSRVETIKRLLQKSGLASRAPCQLSSCIREPTTRLYQSRGLSFLSLGRERGFNPISATIPLIVDFLIHLRQDKGFSNQRCRGAFPLPRNAPPNSPCLGQASRGTPCLVLPRVSFCGLEGGVSQFCTRIHGLNSRPIFPQTAARELHGTDSTSAEQLSQRETPVSGANSQVSLEPHLPISPEMWAIVLHLRTHRTPERRSLRTLSPSGSLK